MSTEMAVTVEVVEDPSISNPVEEETPSDKVIDTDNASEPVPDDNLSDTKSVTSDQNALFYEQEIARLKGIISIQNIDNQNLETKMTENELLAKQRCEELEQNFTLKLEQTLKNFKDGQNEKTSSLVMKYAQGEKKLIELNRTIDSQKRQLGESDKAKQRLNERFEKMKLEKEKISVEYEKKILEIMVLKKDTIKLKETIIVTEAREKRTESLLKQEIEAHISCKESLEKALDELNTLKEKINLLQTGSILENDEKTSDSQTSEKPPEISENPTEGQLTIQTLTESTSPSKLSPNKQASPSNKETVQNERNLKELQALKNQLKDMFEERATLRDNLQAIEKERKLQESSISKFKETLQSQKQMNKDLLTEILQLRELQETLSNEKHEKANVEKSLREEKANLEKTVAKLTDDLKELEQEMELSQKKQGELLLFTSKLTEKNTQLQSENTTISEKLNTLESELSAKLKRFEDAANSTKLSSESLTKQLADELAKNTRLDEELQAKKKEIEELSVKLSDVQDENVTLQRKHQNNVKDLSRQLQQLQKKLSSPNPPNSMLSQKPITSRQNSTCSLNDKDTFPDTKNSHSISEDTQSLNEAALPRASSRTCTELIPGNEDVYVVDVDKQKIIEKYVKLQKLLAKRNEKIDFLQDHVNQLTADLKRKTKIIQAYAMTESEVGAFTSEAHDAIKREMSRKTGHMSTLYNTNKSYIQTAQFINSNETNMTKELCMEINARLQALLEDTLIKNLTLKDSIETLGTEIARLAQENRQILEKQKG